MNSSDYSFAVFLMILAFITGLIQGVIYMFLGNQMFFQDFFIAWFILTNAINFTSIAFLAKYFYSKSYRPALLTLLLSAIATLIQVVLFYMMIVERKFDEYYFQALTFSLFSGLLLGGALTFSESSKRKWLKITGVLLMISSGILMAIAYWSVSAQDFQFLSTLDKSAKWVSLGTAIIPIFLALNFQDELKSYSNAKFKIASYAYGILGILFILAFLTISIPFATACYSQVYWQGKNQERADQLTELFEENTFVGSQGDSLQYLLLRPVQFDSTKEYPLVVSLPYAGYHASTAQVLSENVNRLKYPAYIFVPFCPEGKGWGGVPNTPVIDKLVFEAIEALDEQENIDKNRRYITGVSRGGYGTWHFITARPDLFAAAIPVCGEGDTSLASKITQVAVWAFHGEKDRNVPVNGSREMIEAIEAAGGNPLYTEYENEGHNIWYQVSSDPDLWPWLFTQHKEKSAQN
ncbi:prolyl oligopeptidase family serine peptidase [Algoriphagus sp. D3-2-R+10]|uniref:carboxylesterase family protein n=1 Tax=Algoriphagus aurantiacus TaxID=3103948 RepID=UPI002B3C3B41|nr:prolyl oligopeptidase family serine peptidase [Algoriphagus sp. D3-2-R+10]MEB2775271.1 prolyl oligopeptidase family serine peptidase [Algoriphagus sp. D3-2-R+10]